MVVVQMLYEGVEIKGEGSVGFIIYMRIDLIRIFEEVQQAVRNFILQKFGREYFFEKLRVYKIKKDVQDVYEVIRFIYLEMDFESIKDFLIFDQYKLYKFIYDRFLVLQMESSIYEVFLVEFEVEGYIFKFIGLKFKFVGFMEVYVEGKDIEDEEEENQFLEIREGEILKFIKFDSKQYFIQLFLCYIEVILIKVLEEKGIGRLSIYVLIIQIILERGYVVKEDRFLKLIELGKFVINIFKEYFKDIIDIEFIVEFEENFDKIEEGKFEWIEVVRKYYQLFEKEFEIVRNIMLKVKVEDEEIDIVCENCGRKMVIKKGRYGKFLVCSGYFECKNIKFYYDYFDVLCLKCGKRIIEKKFKKGKRYYMCEGYFDCDFILWEKLAKNCLECGNFMFEKGRKGNKKFVCLNENCVYEEKIGEKGE